MTLSELIKRSNFSYVSLETVANMISNGCNACLTGSDIFQFLTEVAGITYDADQQGVVTHFGFVFDTLHDLDADDLDIPYCFGVDYDEDDRQGIVDAIDRIWLKLSDDDKWMTVIISENGD
jgi:hypothetical protein